MKIILRQDFEKLGKLGDIVEVKDGYARNYLLPRRIGYIATKGSLKTLEEEKKQHVDRKKKEVHQAEKLAADLEKISVTLKDRKSTRLNSSHVSESRMPSSA